MFTLYHTSNSAFFYYTTQYKSASPDMQFWMKQILHHCFIKPYLIFCSKY